MRKKLLLSHFQIDILLHPLSTIRVFVWKDISNNGQQWLNIRNKKTTWKVKILSTAVTSIVFQPDDQTLYMDGVFIGKNMFMCKINAIMSIICKL